MLFLFPSDYFNPKQIDPDYAVEYEAVSQIPELKTVLFGYDTFVSDGTIKLYPKDYYTGECIYRGWMLNPEQYSALYSYLQSNGITLINSPDAYCACHLFPNVLSTIEAYTPKSLVFANPKEIDWFLVNKTFKRFMIKDYVKSVKETKFPTCFDAPVETTEMNRRIAEFIELRGKLFTGGIVLKEYIDFKRYGNNTNEYRAFYLNGQLLSLSKNSNQPDTCASVPPEFVNQFKNLPSRFYTVDFAELADGSWIIIETGDGQVSGLSPGQWEFKYYDDIRNVLFREEQT